MTHIEEFERFENGHTYTIEFTDDGVIMSASIYIPEMDREIDVTSYISTDVYWVKRVSEWLAERDSTHDESKYFKAYKDA